MVGNTLTKAERIILPANLDEAIEIVKSAKTDATVVIPKFYAPSQVEEVLKNLKLGMCAMIEDVTDRFLRFVEEKCCPVYQIMVEGLAMPVKTSKAPSCACYAARRLQFG